MKRSKPNALPEDILQQFQDDRSDSRHEAIRVWELLDAATEETLHIPTTEQALLDLESRIDAETGKQRYGKDRGPVQRKHINKQVRGLAFRVVCTCLLLVLCGMGYLAVPVGYQTSNGETKRIDLPDGSIVELNNASSIRYHRGFRHWTGRKLSERKIYLDGEAYFIAAKERRPLRVETYNSEVTVLGTEFNVRAYASDTEGSIVVLDHGRVMVEPLGEPSQSGVIIDQRGEQVLVIGTTIQKAEDDGNQSLEWITAWREAGFVAIDLSAEPLFRQIERRYGVTLTAAVDLPLSSVNLIYPKEAPAIEQLLTDLCIAESCHFQRLASGYHLTASE